MKENLLLLKDSKSMYIDKLDDMVNKYDNAYHRAIKMKSVDLKSSTYIDSSKEIKKFKILFNILRNKFFC